MKYLHLAFAALALSAATVSAAEVKKNDIAIVPAGDFVQVMNPGGIGDFAFGATCHIEAGGEMRAFAFFEELVLVMYVPPSKPTESYLCLRDTFYFMKTEEFKTATATYEENVARKKRMREFLAQVFKQ